MSRGRRFLLFLKYRCLVTLNLSLSERKGDRREKVTEQREGEAVLTV